ncbi:transient receptor potential cation channel subfamily M member 2 isoform X5 [Pelodiscus sinensis]|uniref:transient receptor potential cation channel subfamily M member 2 isoform X5 n=1 Tax=Pelodiscus sinensis TaxID=13735 RepID=UPI003F6B63D4
MLPLELNGVFPEEEDGYMVHPKSCDLEMVPNLRHNNRGFCKSRRKARFATDNNEKENLSSWIPENIRKKECVYFVESSLMSDTGRVMCECGYPKEQHLEEATKPSVFLGKEWDPKRHIQEMPTDAFGDISFAGLGPKVGKYVRVSVDTPPCLIYRLMTQHWGLDAPNLLISVTGGAKNFNMMPRLKNIFRRGLVKVAQTTGAWIITGGSHAGVMKQVGEAVRDFSMSSSCKEGEIVTIGIATWGTVHNRSSLICPTGGFPAEYVLDEESQGSLSCLDSNHSHFLLVDDGTHGRYGVEIPLRTRLERFISEQTKVKGGVAIQIPIVCVVLEGGPGTLETVHGAITKGTPCVVVEGSGRVADVIAQVAHRPVPEITIALVRQKLNALFRDTDELFTEGRLVEWTKKIQDIVRSRQLLTIFREGKDGLQDVDVAILQALLKASRSRDHFGHENWDQQLKLAVAWNRVDIARSEIFTDDHEWKRPPLLAPRPGPLPGWIGRAVTALSGLPARRPAPRHGRRPDREQAGLREALPGAGRAPEGVRHLGHPALPLREPGARQPLPRQAAEGAAGGEGARGLHPGAPGPAAPRLAGAAGAARRRHTAAVPEAQARRAAPALPRRPAHQAERAGGESPLLPQALGRPRRLLHGPGQGPPHLGCGAESQGAGGNHLGPEPGLHRRRPGLQQAPQGAVQGGGRHGQHGGDAEPGRGVRAPSHWRLHGVPPQGRGASPEAAGPRLRGLGQEHLLAAGAGGQEHALCVPRRRPGRRGCGP